MNRYNESVPNRPSDAHAAVIGSSDHSGIRGTVDFYETPIGVLVSCRISGLPRSVKPCESPVFAFHIHSGGSCTGNISDPFADALTHYNPKGCPHPYHAGDLPPLFSAKGYAYSAFLADRFTVKEIVGKTIIIHASPDDFTTQPSGNAGVKIACGVIKAQPVYPSRSHVPSRRTDNII